MSVYISLKKKNLDALYVTDPLNIFYLTGFKGVSETEREATVIITEDHKHLIVPKLYEQEGKQCERDDVKLWVLVGKGNFSETVKEILGSVKSLGFEADHMKYSEYEQLSKKLKIKLVPTSSFLENVRIIKTAAEIEKTKQAAKLTNQVFSFIKDTDKQGMTERELVRKIKDYIFDLGVDISFDPIVAFGKNSALPHFVPSTDKIGEGILLVDLGVKYKGYCGDMTRTYYLGKPNQRYKDLYELVQKANREVIKAIKPGVTEDDLWGICEQVLGEDIKNMPHTLGHGIGLGVHENPRIYKDGNRKLESGMVITIEPGLYYPGWGGVRIEDYVLVTEKGCEVLS